MRLRRRLRPRRYCLTWAMLVAMLRDAGMDTGPTEETERWLRRWLVEYSDVEVGR